MAIWAELKKAINSDVSKPLNELINEWFSKGTVKSVQRGIISVEGDFGASAENSAIISEVNLEKSIVVCGGRGGTVVETTWYCQLKNPTTVVAGGYFHYGGTINIPYEVIEFY